MLKMDIGEIVDQIYYDFDGFDGILFDSIYKELPNTQGEHFLLSAYLIKL